MKWPWPHERAYTVYCLDEDFGEPIWKRTTPPGMAMLGNTGSGPHGVATQSQINALDCDDERIVIGLERVSPADIDQTTFGGGVRSFVGRLVDVRQCFTVQCLNAEGGELWRTDTGGNVSDLVIIPGVGVAVAHAISHDYRDPLTISIPGAAGLSAAQAGSFVVSDEFGFAGGNVAQRTPREIELACRMRGQPPNYTFLQTTNFNRWDTYFGCTGGLMSAGMTFRFDSLLAGPRGLRPMLQCAYTPSINDPTIKPVYSCPSLANVTMLNLETGEILWRRYTLASASPSFVSSLFQLANICSDRNGSVLVFRYRDLAGNPDGFTVLDYNGAIVDQVDFSGVAFINLTASRQMTTDGSSLFVQGSRYDMAGARDAGWNAVQPPYWFDHDTGLLWGSVTGGAAPCTPGTGTPTTANRFPAGSRPLTNGLIATHQTGSVPSAYETSGKRIWRYIDTAKFQTTIGARFGARCGDRFVVVTTRGGNDYATGFELAEVIEPYQPPAM